MRRSKWTLGSVLVATALCVAAPVGATPLLQLDISGGYYVGGSEESTFSSGPVFTLWALVDTTNTNKYSADLLGQLYVSAALVPITTAGGDYGSFTFGGRQVNVTADMAFGAPPLESSLLASNSNEWDNGDLATHGIFETYYTEMRLPASGWQRVTGYNVQDNPGDPTLNTTGAMMAYAIPIDVSGLMPGYAIHFDLYSESIKNGDIDADMFAPFSHDAESSTPVPEPASLLLLGTGLSLFGLASRRKKK